MDFVKFFEEFFGMPKMNMRPEAEKELLTTMSKDFKVKTKQIIAHT